MINHLLVILSLLFSSAAQANSSIESTLPTFGFALEEILWRAGVWNRPQKLVLKRGVGEGRYIFRVPKLSDQSFYGACGSFHYNPDSPDWIDAYVHPKAGCVFMQILQKWRQDYCKSSELGCRLSWGDISHYSQNYFSGHKTHTHGFCIDMRPFRQGAFANTPLWYTDPAYDQKTTREFLRMIRAQFNPSPVYFNDPLLIKEGLSTAKSGHDNHIHFCLPQNREDEQSCRNYRLNEKICPFLADNEME